MSVCVTALLKVPGSNLMLLNFKLRILHLESQKSHNMDVCLTWCPGGNELNRKSLVVPRLVQVVLCLRGVKRDKEKCYGRHDGEDETLHSTNHLQLLFIKINIVHHNN